MARQIFSNNVKATISGAITDVATSIALSTGQGAMLAALTGGNWTMLTLVSAEVNEIVKVTAISGDTLTVVRAQEGTTAKAWPTQSSIEEYVTAGAVNSFATLTDITGFEPNHGVGTDSLAYGYGATATGAYAVSYGRLANGGGTTSISVGCGSSAPAIDSVAVGHDALTTMTGQVALGALAGNPGGGTTARANSTAYVLGDIRIHASTKRCKCIKAGTSAGSPPSVPSNSGEVFTDGTVIWRLVPLDDNDYGVNIGNSSIGSAVAVGISSVGYGVSVGRGAISAYDSLAIGNGSTANASKSIALGRYSAVYDIKYSLSVNALPAMAHAFFDYRGFESEANTGLDGLLSTEPVDLTGGVTWTATTAVNHGGAMRPTAGSGKHFIRYDNNYDKNKDPTGALYSASSTGSSEPTWPTAFNDSVNDGGGYWTCIPHDGSYVIPLQANMVVEEVMFVCFEGTSISAQANISIGTTGNLTKIVNNQATVGLTADNTICKWTLTQPVIVPDITIKIDTLATGTKMLGKFIFRGFYIKKW